MLRTGRLRYLDRRAEAALAGLSPGTASVIRETSGPVSVPLEPDGRRVGEPRRDEGLLFAQADLAACVEHKQFHDVVISYNRFDIFRFEVDQKRRPTARFLEGIDMAVAPGGHNTDAALE